MSEKYLPNMKVFFLITLFSGSVWGFIYLLFSRLHSMDKMFNKEFIFVVPKIIGVQVLTSTMGFVFSFLDGAIFGVIFTIIIFTIKRFVSK